MAKKSPKDFDLLYNKYWMFNRSSKIYNNEFLKKRIRYNPDGVDTNWIFNMKGKHIYILSVYRDDADDIGDVNYIGVYLEKENDKYIVPNNAKIYDLVEIPEFNYFFENLWGNHYHPNEIQSFYQYSI